MRTLRTAVACAMAFPCAPGWAQDSGAPSRTLGVVTIQGGQPTSLPTQIPTTMEGITREQVEQSINATDSEDALRYFPSLLVRKRYVGDYNHAILSSRASGTGNSARSLVYADGILLSNLLGNGVGGLSFPPRWGLVTPEEIERVDVMYGPFSAAYPGNSVGAVVDYVTRMPKQLEGHAKLGYVHQPFRLFGTDDTYRAWQASASVGSRSGDWSYWFNVNRTDSEGQPLTFASRPAPAGAPVPPGAVPGRSPTDAPIYYIGSGTQYHTVQDHAKLKVAYDVTPALRAAYTFGWWENRSEGRPRSYLAPGATLPVTGADFPVTNERATHFIHGLSVRSSTRGTWDWEVSGSLYDYARDEKRQNAAGNPLPGSLGGGPGTLADGSGTGWNTLAARATWRPDGPAGPHIVEFGAQQESYRLDYLTSAIAGNFLADAPGAPTSEVGGRTRLQSLWAQDVWRFAPKWKAVLGARAEHWSAYAGRSRAAPAAAQSWPSRSENHLSPKAAVSWQWRPDTVLKASAGRAVRFPTVAELYGGVVTPTGAYINDPNLKAERSWTGELSAEKDLGNALLRLTAFAEDTRDALYAQPDLAANISRVQNVGRIATRGLELAYNGADVAVRGLDVTGSVTYAHSRVRENAGFPASIGKRQPNVPDWRASLLLAYRWNPAWTTSVGARYSGLQFRTLDNSDVNGHSYMGVSRFFVVDLRAHWRIHKGLGAAFGIDNVNNDKYWNFHPYPQRSYVAELKADF